MNENIKAVNLPSGLYLVATPIGNLRDITLRALDVLAAVDMIVCEDTRVSGKLLSAYGISKKMTPYNDHNAARQRGPLVEALSNGARIAMISDAGTPLVSDPGFKLVRDCLDLGLNVTALPGANAPLTALQLSGLPSDKFSFLGFLPPKSAGRQKILQGWKDSPAPLIIFETGPRLEDSLRDMLAVLGDRAAAVTRELTKMYEEARRGTLGQLVAHYEESGAPKGEIVVVVGGAGAEEYDEAALEEMLREALSSMSVKDAAAHVAERTGQSKKSLYEMALKLEKQ